MTLDVAICTFSAEGIKRVANMHLPKVDGVTYIISWQKHDDLPVPEALMRDDVKIFRADSIGLSKNRNNALAQCGSDIVLIADDDLIYTPDNLKSVMSAFDDNPDVELATFRYCDGNGNIVKTYPNTRHNLHRQYKFYFVTSFEIAFKLDAVRQHGLQFSELAGIGAPYLHAGEELLFLHHCLSANLKSEFFPITITKHCGPTTSTRQAKNPGVIRARGACLRIVRGNITALTRLPIEAWRTPGNKLKALFYLVQGYAYSIRHTKEL